MAHSKFSITRLHSFARSFVRCSSSFLLVRSRIGERRHFSPLMADAEAVVPPDAAVVPPDDPPPEDDQRADDAPRGRIAGFIAFVRKHMPKRPVLSRFERAVGKSRLLKKIRKDFVKFDRDRSGTIDREELCAVVGIDRRSLWTRKLLDFFDTDGDNQVSFEEFTSTLGILGARLDKYASEHKRGDRIPKEVFFIFALLDLDGDGELNRGEFAPVLWEWQRTKERQFGKLKRLPVVNFSEMDASLEVTATERYIAQQRADRREFLRPVRARVRSAILYISRQCPTKLKIEDAAKIYHEYPELFEVAVFMNKKLRKTIPRCLKLIRELHDGIDDVENLQKQVIELLVHTRLAREQAKGKWHWAKKLHRNDSKEDSHRLDEQTIAEITQISRLLRGEKIVKPSSEEEHEFLGSFSVRRDGSFRRMESRRLRGPRATGRGNNSQETFRMRTRQLTSQPPHDAAVVLAELGVTAQKEVIRRLDQDVAANIIAEMGQLQQDILLSHFKLLEPLVRKIKRERHSAITESTPPSGT